MGWSLGSLCTGCVAMLMTIENAAQVYGVSTSTIKRWKKNGKIKFVQPYGKGGHVMIVMEETNGKEVN